MWTVVRAVLVVLIIGGAGVYAYLNTREEAPPPIETQRYENPEAGYTFEYPKAWTLREDGTAAIVTHPDREALVSFGLGAKGPLEESSATLVEQIQRNNTDIEVGETQPQTVSGHHALAVNGVGANKQGQRIRFLAVTVRAANRNFSIVIYAAEDADPENIVAPTQAILASFKPPGG